MKTKPKKPKKLVAYGWAGIEKGRIAKIDDYCYGEFLLVHAIYKNKTEAEMCFKKVVRVKITEI